MIAESGHVKVIRFFRWLAWPYGWAARLRAMLYRRRWLPTYRLPRPVISIGNLTVGGTGKTPVVILVAEWLLARGKRVAVLSRGYRRRSLHEHLLVSDGHRLLAGPDQAGDEPYLIAQRCPSALVAVGPDRYRLGRWVLDHYPVDCFVLDDGYQHLHLHRDLDVLLLDATDLAGLQALLPVGRLREPLSAASRASVFLLTRADSEAQGGLVWDCVRRACGRLPEPIKVFFKADELIRITTGERQSVASFRETRALLFSGIGNAGAFHDLVKRLGIVVVDAVVLPDHTRYDDSALNGVRERAKQAEADILVTTEKDAGKIKALLSSHDPCWALSLYTDIPVGREHLEQVILSATAGCAMEVCA
jgi:tetraacyldisaccharide 4'-kinase